MNVWWRMTISRVYPIGDDDTPKVTGESWEQLTGLPTGTLRVTRAKDIHLKVTQTSVSVDRSAKMLTETIDYPDAIYDASKVTRNGLVQSSTSKIGVTTTYGYDALGRQVTVTDPKTGTTTTVYVTSDTPPSGKLKGYVDYMYDADSRTTSYTYDSAGRTASITNPDDKVQYSVYTSRGELERTWGETTYPVRYVYDDYGRRIEMYTFRSGSAWDQSSWPDPEPSGDKTTWIHEEATGLLLKKLYADATEQDPSIAYTYTADGKLLTRTWRRGVTTGYLYHDGTSGTLLTGELRSVSYSDGTPSVQYTYNRMGQFATVTDVLGANSHVFAYNNDLQVETETIDIDGSTDLDRVITRKYWASPYTSYTGNDMGFQIGTTQDPDADYDATYYYAALLGGRLVRVTGPGRRRMGRRTARSRAVTC